MEVSIQSIAVATVLAVLTTWAWRVVNSVWWRPKRLERLLRQQGLFGKPYTFLFGDLKKNSRLLEEANSKPITIFDDIKPRLLPFLHQSSQTYGYAVAEGRPVRESRLSCCGIGVGWFLFILGFFLGAIPWYIGLLLLVCGRIDYREKPGYIACTIAAILATIAIVLGVTREADDW